MCFSASVSFGSAALLVTTGAVTTLGATSKQQRMIAAVPFLFGVQQAAEGIVWKTMEQGADSTLHQFGILLFLTFAFVVWPSWVPWSFYKIENNEKRKKILKMIGVLGLVVSVLVISVMLSVEVKAYIVGHSLGYAFLNLNRNWPPNLEALLYFTPTVVPFFISSLRTIKKAGVLIFASMILAQLINREASTSVWCFFAALVSFYIAVNVLWVQRGKLS